MKNGTIASAVADPEWGSLYSENIHENKNLFARWLYYSFIQPSILLLEDCVIGQKKSWNPDSNQKYDFTSSQNQP